jgi:hypothetical protein
MELFSAVLAGRWAAAHTPYPPFITAYFTRLVVVAVCVLLVYWLPPGEECAGVVYCTTGMDYCTTGMDGDLIAAHHEVRSAAQRYIPVRPWLEPQLLNRPCCWLLHCACCSLLDIQSELTD